MTWKIPLNPKARRNLALMGHLNEQGLETAHSQCRTLKDMTAAERRALEERYGCPIREPKPGDEGVSA